MGRNKKTRVSKEEDEKDPEIGGADEPSEKEKSLYEVIGTDLSLHPLFILQDSI